MGASGGLVTSARIVDGTIATADLAAGAVTQAFFKAANVAFTAAGTAWTGDVGASSLDQTITTTGGKVLVTIVSTMTMDVGAAYGRISVFRVDLGAPVATTIQRFPVAGEGYAMVCQALDSPAAGTYQYIMAGQCAAAGNVLRWMADAARTMVVVELKK